MSGADPCIVKRRQKTDFMDRVGVEGIRRCETWKIEGFMTAERYKQANSSSLVSERDKQVSCN